MDNDLPAVLAAASADHYGNAYPPNQLNSTQCAASPEQAQGTAHGLFDRLAPPDLDEYKPGLDRALVGEAEPERLRSLFERITPPPHPARKAENKIRSVFDNIPLVRPNGDAHNPFLTAIPAHYSASNPYSPRGPSTATPTSSRVPTPQIAAPAANTRCLTSLRNSDHTNSANNNTGAETLKSALDTMAGLQPSPSTAAKTAEVYSNGYPFAAGGYSNDNSFTKGEYSNSNPTSRPSSSNLACGSSSSSSTADCKPRSLFGPISLPPATDQKRPGKGEGEAEGDDGERAAGMFKAAVTAAADKPRSLFDRISFPASSATAPNPFQPAIDSGAAGGAVADDETAWLNPFQPGIDSSAAAARDGLPDAGEPKPADQPAQQKPRSLFNRISSPASSTTIPNAFQPATDSWAAGGAVADAGAAWPNPFQLGIDPPATTARDGLPAAGEHKPADQLAQQKPRSLSERISFPPGLGQGAGRAADSAGTGTGPAPCRKTVRFEGVVSDEEDGEADSPSPPRGFSTRGAVPQAPPASQASASWNPAPPEEGTAATQEPKAQVPPKSEAQSPQAYAPPSPQVNILPRPEAQKSLKRKAQVPLNPEAQAPLKPGRQIPPKKRAQVSVKPRAQMPPNLKAQTLPEPQACPPANKKAQVVSLKTKAQPPPPKPLPDILPRPEAQIPREPQALLPREPLALAPPKPEAQIP